MKCIAAVDNNWAIGFDNRLLFHIPDDLHFFKKKTLGKAVIMGKNTLLSLPKQAPLPNRVNIVLSTSLTKDGCVICDSLQSLFEAIKSFNSDDLFVIGGEQIYNLLLPYCDEAYITKVNADSNGNRFFPNLDLSDNWELIYKGEKRIHNNLEFYFCRYKNNSVKVFE